MHRYQTYQPPTSTHPPHTPQLFPSLGGDMPQAAKPLVEGTWRCGQKDAAVFLLLISSHGKLRYLSASCFDFSTFYSFPIYRTQRTGEITKSIKFLRTVLWVADYTMQVVFKINTTRHKTSLCVQFSGKPIQQISVGGFVTSFQEAKTCKYFQGDKLKAVALA